MCSRINGVNKDMSELKIKYNELTADQFIELWETVWGDGPTLEQTELAMKHTLFRVSIWDDNKIVAMARMKEELFYNRGRRFENYTIEALKTMAGRYFMSYWSNRRICSAIGGIPPAVKRHRFYSALTIAA